MRKNNSAPWNDEWKKCWGHVMWMHFSFFLTRVGIVCVEEVDLLTSISIHITGCNSNSISCSIPQGVVWRVAIINSDVHQSVLSAIVLQHQVGPIKPEGKHHTFVLHILVPFPLKKNECRAPPVGLNRLPYMLENILRAAGALYIYFSAPATQPESATAVQSNERMKKAKTFSHAPCHNHFQVAVTIHVCYSHSIV